jgi:hypothetical protein
MHDNETFKRSVSDIVRAAFILISIGGSSADVSTTTMGTSAHQLEGGA